MFIVKPGDLIYLLPSSRKEKIWLCSEAEGRHRGLILSISHINSTFYRDYFNLEIYFRGRVYFQQPDAKNIENFLVRREDKRDDTQ